jgi:hypothetical protein
MADFVAPYVPDFTPVIQDRRNFEEQKRKFDEELNTRKQQFEEQQRLQKIQEATNLQSNYLSLASQVSDKNALGKLISVYNQNPLVKETGLTMDVSQFENIDISKKPTPKTATDLLAKQKAIVFGQNPELATRYNAGDQAAVLEVNRQAAELARQGATQKQFEPEMYKVTAALAKENIQQIGELDKANSSLRSTIETAKNIDDKDFGIGSTYRTSPFVNSLADTLGINTRSWQDVTDLKKQIDALALSSMKATLGSQFTEREGKVLRDTLGDVSTQKAVVLFGLNLRNAEQNYNKERLILETTLYETNPGSPIASKKKSNALLDFDKFIRVINPQTGGKELFTFYDFKDLVRSKNPAMPYSEVVKAWGQLLKEKGVKGRIPTYSTEDMALLDSNL